MDTLVKNVALGTVIGITVVGFFMGMHNLAVLVKQERVAILNTPASELNKIAQENIHKLEQENNKIDKEQIFRYISDWKELAKEGKVSTNIYNKRSDQKVLSRAEKNYLERLGYTVERVSPVDSASYEEWKISWRSKL